MLKNIRLRFGRRQGGVASLLFTAMVGLSLTAVMVGGNYYLRSTQEQSVSVHAQTQAQASVWTAAEITREYLSVWSNSEDDWPDFAEGLRDQLGPNNENPININLGMNGVTGTIVALKDEALPNGETVPHVTAVFSAVAADGSRAEASTSIRVSFAPLTPVNEIQPIIKNTVAVTIQGDLSLTGGIKVHREQTDDAQYEMNVKGSVTISSASISTIDILRSTGSINFNSGMSWFQALHSNCDVRLHSSGGASVIEARNDVCISGVPNASGNYMDPQILANGAAVIRGGRYSSIMTLAGVGNFNHCASEELKVCQANNRSNNFDGIELDPSITVGILKTKGNLTMTSGLMEIGSGAVQGDINSSWHSGIGNVIYGGERTGPDNPSHNFIQQDDYEVEITEAPLVNIDSQTMQDYRSYANYSFSADHAGRVLVKVKDVNGIADGNYLYYGQAYLEGDTRYNVLCRPKGMGPDLWCSESIALGWGHNGVLITHSQAGWLIAGTTMAPGIVHFEGDVNIANGEFYNLFIASGNIKSSAGVKIYAPNYAGYEGWPSLDAPHGYCDNKPYSNYTPTQLCRRANDTFDYSFANGIGNYALLAGSCRSGPGALDECTNYSGGDITFDGKTEVFGSVMAANRVVTGGSAYIKGYITALGLTRPNERHELSAYTEIDLRNLPDGFDPGGLIDRGDGVSIRKTALGKMSIRWSRYL